MPLTSNNIMAPIITALCSFGMSGKVFHAPFIDRHPGFQLYAVWERSKKLTAEFYPLIKSFSTLEEMLADKSIELVIINTPNYSHYEYAKKALEAGKHIVVEKPFTVTVVEASELVTLAEKKGKLISVFQNRRWDSDYQTVKNVIRQELLGEIVEAELHYDRYNPVLSPKAHKETPGPGTGVLYDLGSHLIDQAVDLFGKPEAVFADLNVLRPNSKVPDYMEVLLYYKRLRVRLKSGYFIREAPAAYMIHGSKGSFFKSRADVQEVKLQAGEKPGEDWGKEPDEEKGLLHTELNGQVIKKHVNTIPGNYGAFYQSVYDAIRENKEPVIKPAQALLVMRIIEAAIESNKEKKVINLDLD
jgi:scyllo-inositol 2-dehydrogenase (NADP+)